MHITKCPLCRAANVVHPGEPPGIGDNYYNRCQAAALTGQRGYERLAHNFPLGWKPPRRSLTIRCGEPLVDASGNIRPPIPLNDFIKATRHDFAVESLRALIPAH